MEVVVGRMRYVSRVVEGTFPNYKEIIPKTFATEVTVLKNDLVEMLRKACEEFLPPVGTFPARPSLD